MTTLRPCQNEGRYQCNTLLNAKRHPLLVMPTGTGKTKTACEIIRDRIKLKRKIFVLVPQDEIFTQWLNELSLAGLNPGYINSEGFKGRDRMVYVCMPLSLDNMLQRLPESSRPDEIITDESHHSQASTWTNVYKHYDNASRLGLTGTPLRMDNKPLGEWYTDIVEPIDMQTAIDSGYLTEPLIIVPEILKMNVPIQNGEFSISQQLKKLGDPEIIGDAIEQYSKIFCGSPILVACCTYAHAKQVTKQFVDAGWKFEHIHSGLSGSDRKRMIREVKAGKINGLCTVGIGIEGLDIPGLYGLIWMRRTMSLTIYLQLIGRVLRLHENKKYGIIIDCVGNIFLHGRPEMKRHWSLDTDYIAPDEDEITIEMKVCPICSVMNAKENLYCHVCNRDFNELEIDGKANSRKFPKMIDGELVVLSDSDHEEFINQKLTENKEEAAEEIKEKDFLSAGEKIEIMKKDLTGKNRRDNFSEALRNFV